MCLRTVSFQHSWQSTPRWYYFFMWATCFYKRKLCTAVFALPCWHFNICMVQEDFVFLTLLKTCQNKLLAKLYTNLQKKDWSRPVWNLYLQNDLVYQSRGYHFLMAVVTAFLSYFLLPLVPSQVYASGRTGSLLFTNAGERKSCYFFHGVRKTLWKTPSRFYICPASQYFPIA